MFAGKGQWALLLPQPGTHEGTLGDMGDPRPRIGPHQGVAPCPCSLYHEMTNRLPCIGSLEDQGSLTT